MKNLSTDQKRALADFFANFAVAWLTVGIIAPILSEAQIPAMLYLTRGGNRK